MGAWTTKATTPALATAASTTALDVSQLKDMVAVVSGITTGTIKVEVSEDGVVYTQVGADLTADGRTSVAMPRARFARIRATVATSIAAKLTVSGESVPPLTAQYSNS